MKLTVPRSLTGLALVATAVLPGLFMKIQTVSAKEKSPFRAAGLYVEGCSCSLPCPCELTGLEKGCNGVGALSLKGGDFNGVSLTGVKIAYAGVPGEWVNLYIEAAKPEQRDAATAFAKAYYSTWGKNEIAREARITIKGNSGRYTVEVDDGKVMSFKTEPVMGGDGRLPISISNTKNTLSPTFQQGRTLSGKYEDGGHSFTLKDSNSYFNERMNSTGRL